ncbi:Rieske 2Fe-2S domain-containing protein [Fischerella thermalis]|uniref:Rieske 2Fe-2S domain-containing protein n=1 Tax=Fischerella thermalis TaxID=372787 RepID=UPI003C6CE1FA
MNLPCFLDSCKRSIVNWNSAEKSWDCPCHVGRFDCDGKVLHGPPVKDLESYGK